VNKDKPQLACNGKCHLADQLKITTPSDNDDSKAVNSLSESFFPVFIEISESLDFSVSAIYVRLNLTNADSFYSYEYSSLQLRPPIV